MILMEKKQRPIVTIHPDCAVTTPYDVWANRTLERKHGTCGTGIYRTKKRHYENKLTFTVNDIFSKDSDYIVHKLKKIRNYYKMSKCPEEKTFLIALAMLQSQPDINAEISVFDEIPHGYRHKVFEGSQGLMLDEHIGYMPHCSPSDITPRNVLNLVEKIDEIYLVSRVYQTRHGNGPMTNTDHPLSLINTERENNKLNKYQGEFRTSILDLDQFMHAKVEGIDKVVPSSTKINLVMTCADQVSSYKVSLYGEILTFHCPEAFVRFVGMTLRINGDLYVNISPYSTTVKRISNGQNRTD
jgi:adenylosuccinate synthase